MCTVCKLFINRIKCKKEPRGPKLRPLKKRFIYLSKSAALNPSSLHVEWHCNNTNEIFSTPKIKNLLSFLTTSQFLNWSRCSTGVDFAPPWSLLGQSSGARRDCVMTHSFAYVIQIRRRSQSPQTPPPLTTL